MQRAVAQTGLCYDARCFNGLSTGITAVTIAIFDLDNTLLNGDSDHSWGQFLVDNQWVNADTFRAANDTFYRQYQDGTLDIHEYLTFALTPLAQHDDATLAQWHRHFMRDYIEPMILPPAEALIERHRRAGDTLMIITATNSFVTAPIASRLGIPHLLASEAERDNNGRYTGRPCGIPCFQQGKVQRLQQWLADNSQQLDGAYFYSDSHNDLPLLQQVDHPVAVDPDDRLRRVAEDSGWPVISLRH